MPLLANAKKALRSSNRKAEVNSRVRSKMKTMVAKFRKEPQAPSLSSAYSAIDKAVKKHLVSKNKAARMKSQLGKLVSA